MNMYIDYEKGKKLGNKLQDEAKVIEELLLKLNEIQEKLEGNLKDEIDNNYSKPLFSNIKMMNQFATFVDSTGHALSNISSAYTRVEKNGINREVLNNEE